MVENTESNSDNKNMMAIDAAPNGVISLKLSEIVFDETIYPRKDHDPALVQKYASNMESILARGNYLSVARPEEGQTGYRLLDGKHRWLALRTLYEEAEPDKEVSAFEYIPISREHAFSIACQLNREFGWQLTEEDKKQSAIKLYGMGFSQDTIRKKLAVDQKWVSEALKATLTATYKAINEKILAMYLACETQQDIAAAVGLDRTVITKKLDLLCKSYFAYETHKTVDFGEELEGEESEAEAEGEAEEVVEESEPAEETEAEDSGSKIKLTKEEVRRAKFEYGLDDTKDYQPQTCNVWNYHKKSNKVSHFGNSEQSILDNLLWAYTDPLDIVFDPFAGGGASIDVCRARLRRYWVSDRKPIIAQEGNIRKHDIMVDGLPKIRWGDVALVYLDPPYWRQAEGKYSENNEENKTDLAHLDLDQFHETLGKFIKDVAKKLKPGTVIALLMQPTQWKSDDKIFADHIFGIMTDVGNKRLTLENRISCPYSNEQYLPQQVNWAKANHKFLVLTRELVVWRVRDA